MEKKEIEEGNKLIAEFMQFEYDRKDLVTGKILLGIEDCKYNSSWDWITPVFIHIESMGYRTYMVCKSEADNLVEIYDKKHCIASCYSDSKIIAVYKAVLQFIKWYNSKNK